MQLDMGNAQCGPLAVNEGPQLECRTRAAIEDEKNLIPPNRKDSEETLRQLH